MILYAVVSVVFVFDFIIYLNGYSFSGSYSDKVLGWLWLVFTTFIIIKFWKEKTTKKYFLSLLGGIFLSLLPMGIPFLGILYYFSTIGDFQ
ncbi:hypothetical protein [Flavobacterium sp.]|uniref:hypothetical protein n=1 Tax=Flavobacterium sp. TaxID=239 RepID=UPI002612F65D|nr:hypothetical protein [Flavobacterium sp.]